MFISPSFISTSIHDTSIATEKPVNQPGQFVAGLTTAR
jgi:hypothetical protein